MKYNIDFTEWSLRLGFGVMYLYSGYDIVTHPNAWYWALRALPQSLYSLINSFFGPNLFLQIQGIGEILFGLILIFWFIPQRIVQIVAALITIEMALLLLLVGVDAITFRDIGLFGGSLALYFKKLSQT